jgi:hypothetical protein
LTSLIGANFTATFTYDGTGRRVGRVVNGSSQSFVYDGGNILRESGAVNATYTNGLGVDEPLVRRGTQSEYYLTDVLGSVVALADVSPKLTPDIEESEDSEEQYEIITSFGMFWRKEAIEWTPTPKLLGMQQIGATPVDFYKLSCTPTSVGLGGFHS